MQFRFGRWRSAAWPQPGIVDAGVRVRQADWHPVMDFVKPAMWMFEGQPGWAQAFVDGYRLSARWPRCWPERLAVATGLELLAGVDYWARVNDQPMRDDYVRRLRAWVRSEGVDHVWSWAPK